MELLVEKDTKYTRLPYKANRFADIKMKIDPHKVAFSGVYLLPPSDKLDQS